MKSAAISTNLSEAQLRVVEHVRAGKLHTAQTGTHDGNIVQRLVRAGVLVAKNKEILPAEMTYHGRKITQDVVYMGLAVSESSVQTNKLTLVKGATSGFYYTIDRKYRVSSLVQATVSKIKKEWCAVQHYGTPRAVTVASATSLEALRTRLAAHIAKESK